MRRDGDAAATAVSNIALSISRGSIDMQFALLFGQEKSCAKDTKWFGAEYTSNVSVVSGPKRLANGFGDLLGRRLAAEVGRVQ